MSITNLVKTLASGYVGNNMNETYRKMIGKMFVNAVASGLIVAAIFGLIGESTNTLRLLALATFTVTYCWESVVYLSTEEGRKMTDSRFGTDREHEIPSAVRSIYPVFLAVVVGGIAFALLAPALWMGGTGLLVSTFLIVGSPAVIWYRFGRQEKV